jgi:aminopeptidase N
MRILEFPAYETFAESFANTVPFSESIGFIQRYDEGKIRAGESYDLVTFVTAHEVAHQWWGHQLIGAPKQGGTMLAETFAQYSALLVMEKLYGPQMMRQFLKYELDAYLRGRGRESVEELPLVRVEDQDYVHYRKGALVMWWLKDSVGEETVNRSLRRLLARYAFHGAPYASASDFVKILREESPPEAQDLITDLFERITLYDMKALDAHAKRLPDGRYAVRFTVLGRKLYADGLGVETEAPLSEPFEVGAFTVEPGKKGFTAQAVLDLERHPLVSGSQEVRLIVNEPPKWVGVDPYNKRIDRNSDDNLTAVVLDP